jgi:hypothetical protein
MTPAKMMNAAMIGAATHTQMARTFFPFADFGTQPPPPAGIVMPKTVPLQSVPAATVVDDD